MIANPTDACKYRTVTLLADYLLIHSFNFLTAFQAGLVGAITNAGPFDGIISFPKGLTVAWNGSPLGQIAMPNVSFHQFFTFLVVLTCLFDLKIVDTCS